MRDLKQALYQLFARWNGQPISRAAGKQTGSFPNCRVANLDGVQQNSAGGPR